MKPEPQQVLWTTTDERMRRRFRVAHVVPTVDDDKRLTGFFSELPVEFYGTSEQAARQAATDFWHCEQDKMARNAEAIEQRAAKARLSRAEKDAIAKRLKEAEKLKEGKK
jgi:hypothetical protein